MIDLTTMTDGEIISLLLPWALAFAALVIAFELFVWICARRRAARRARRLAELRVELAAFAHPFAPGFYA